MTIRTRASALLLAAVLLLSPSARARGDGATSAPGESQPAASSSAEATPAPQEQMPQQWQQGIPGWNANPFQDFFDFYFGY